VGTGPHKYLWDLPWEGEESLQKVPDSDLPVYGICC
jgi:hypothetical protein